MSEKSVRNRKIKCNAKITQMEYIQSILYEFQMFIVYDIYNI